MIKLDLPYGHLARLPHFPTRVDQVTAQHREALLRAECAESFGSFVADHRAVQNLLIAQDGLEGRYRERVGQLTKDIGYFVFQERGRVGEACRVSAGVYKYYDSITASWYGLMG